MSSNISQLEIKRSLWANLVTDLRMRGGGKRESGAFMLGRIEGAVRQVDSWVPYDLLDSAALSNGYVRLGTQAFTALWARCAELGKVVVADVHTHPLGPRQSQSDRANPMIAQAGHVALIIPNFAQGAVLPNSISVNIYHGAKRWSSYIGRDAELLVRLT